jgi:proline iminopeptidase
MRRMRKLLLVAGVLLIVLIIAAAFVWYWMSGPLYRPGDVRAGKGVVDPLTPASVRSDDVQHWRVAPNIELHHFEDGTGTEILTVHGGPGFPPTRPWLGGRLLADRYEFVYYHQRGCGLSSRPITAFHDPNLYNNMLALHRTLGLPAQVADIERIRRILGPDRLILMGHSFGADLAALYAAEFPEHVRALVFVAPANLAVLPNPQGNVFDLVRDRLPASMKDDYKRYLAEYLDFRRAFQRTEAESSAFYGGFARYYTAATASANVGAAPTQGSDASSAGFLPLAVYLSMGKHHDYSAAYRKVNAPVLVIHGGNDLQSEASSRAFAGLFPMSRFVRIEGAGHFVFDDRPAEFAAIVDRFLSPLKPSAGQP